MDKNMLDMMKMCLTGIENVFFIHVQYPRTMEI